MVDRNSIITKMDYKEFMNVFFTKSTLYAKLSNTLKESYFFMVCKTIAKHDPLFINKFQEHKSWAVMDMLHEKYSRLTVPKWVYASSKQGAKVKEILDKYTKAEINYVLETTQYEMKSLRSLINHNEKKAIELLKDAKNVLKGGISKRKA